MKSVHLVVGLSALALLGCGKSVATCVPGTTQACLYDSKDYLHGMSSSAYIMGSTSGTSSTATATLLWVRSPH